MSSSSSSLDLPPLPALPQDGPASPSIGSGPLAKAASVRQLPDVKEEPMERENPNDVEAYDDDNDEDDNDEEEDEIDQDSFGLYSCLCKPPASYQLSVSHFTNTRFHPRRPFL